MGDVKINCNLASHVQVGDTTGDYRFVLHRGTPELFDQSPGMTASERASGQVNTWFQGLSASRIGMQVEPTAQ